MSRQYEKVQRQSSVNDAINIFGGRKKGPSRGTGGHGTTGNNTKYPSTTPKPPPGPNPLNQPLPSTDHQKQGKSQSGKVDMRSVSGRQGSQASKGQAGSSNQQNISAPLDHNIVSGNKLRPSPSPDRPPRPSKRSGQSSSRDSSLASSRDEGNGGTDSSERDSYQVGDSETSAKANTSPSPDRSPSLSKYSSQSSSRDASLLSRDGAREGVHKGPSDSASSDRHHANTENDSKHEEELEKLKTKYQDAQKKRLDAENALKNVQEEMQYEYEIMKQKLKETEEVNEELFVRNEAFNDHCTKLERQQSELQCANQSVDLLMTVLQEDGNKKRHSAKPDATCSEKILEAAIQVKSVLAEVARLKKENGEQLQKRDNELEDERASSDKYRNERDQDRKKIKQLETQLAKKERDNTLWDGRFNNLEKTHRKLGDERDELTKERNWLESENEKKATEIKNLVSEVQKLKIEVENITQDLLKKENEYKSLLADKTDVARTLRKKSTQYDALESSSKQPQDKLNKQLTTLSQQISGLKAEVASGNTSIKAREEENKKLKATIDDKNKNIKDLKQEVREKDEKIEGLRGQIKQLEREVKDKANVIKKREQEVKERANDTNTLEQEVKGKANVIKKLEQEVKDKAHSIKGLELEVMEKTHNIKGLELEVREKSYDIRVLEQEIKDKPQNIKDLEQEVREKANKIDDLRDQRKELNKDIDRLEKKMRKLKKELEWWSKIDCQLVMPTECRSNEMSGKVLDQVLRQLREDARVELVMKPSASISKQDGLVVLPCVIGSNLESDMSATVNAAKLAPHLRAVMIVFHHVIPEKCRPLALPTQQRVASKYPQCDVIYDAFFWQGKFYSCESNDTFLENFERYISR